MMRLTPIIAMLAAPAFAQGEPESPAGTAFMERCIADIAQNRIELLQDRMPDYAASLSDEELQAGGMSKAVKACPCFLHVIGIDTQSEASEPEAKVAAVVAYLESLESGEARPMPSIVARMTRLCGERSTVLPPRWTGR